ncbi:L,D-transpeptidase family protein [Gordonia desulfuricans]|uniref:L,D-transpeptidase family protein n=1 Tax=Gordonia desulfuricans TaxID=89051 RepID=A0A7K3LMS1_9ACTN|nr:Ig-like domain-containing protein [Gordonia desulfuricans]NDK89555.1 L,D-transpeptidase family protein [Gordonia desulfuricans]
MGSNRTRHRSRSMVLVVGVLMAVVALVTSCSQEASYSSDVSSSVLFDDLLKPGLTITEWGEKPLVDDAVGVQPGAPITVNASEGALTNVRINKADGSQLTGTMSDDGASWTSAEALGYNRSYTLTADAVGVGGASTKKVSFTTRAPNSLTQAYLTPSNGETVGVGQPVAVKFDESIPDRKAAQQAIKITTNPPTEGAFYWISDSEVRWRPKEYWKPGTTVSVAVNTYGIDLGDGLFGQENVKSTFKVGRSMIITADDKTKQVSFVQNGKTIRTMPTSMGKDSTPTDNGVYLVSDKHDNIIMDSSTYGVPVGSADGYRTPVDYATRMSYSGIFFHSAPWSVWAQGNTNTSHGCLNLSPENALWVMNNTLRGDPVVVKNTVGGELPGTDGLGDWNIPWEKWSKGNA